MAGHSKWSNIKHRKNRQDKIRGKIFTKISREIFVAAREGGGDIDTNQKLRMAVNKAKAENMPNDNIDRSIKKALGEVEGAQYEEVDYEGYGPAGVAVLVEVLTDNRNRAAADIRHIFSKHGGNLGEAGCVAWMFDRKGLLTVNREQTDQDEESMMLLAIEAGAEDFQVTEDAFEITVAPDDFETVRASLAQAGLAFSTEQITMIPQNTIALEADDVDKIMRLIDDLEDNDDVQNVHANFDFDETQIEQYGT